MAHLTASTKSHSSRLPPTPDYNDNDRDNAREQLTTLAEVLAHWGGDWLPDIYLANCDFSQSQNDNWIAWREEYVIAILRRQSIRGMFRGDSERLLWIRARNICGRAFDESAAARRARIRHWENTPRTTEAQSEFELAAA